MEYTQQAYATMEKAFEKEISPILQGKAELPDIAAEWAFHYLAMCLLCAPERYEEFKAMVLKRLEWLNNRNEPNVIKILRRLRQDTGISRDPGNSQITRLLARRALLFQNPSITKFAGDDISPQLISVEDTAH